MAEIAQADVVRGVEIRVCAEIAVRKGAERVVDGGQSLGVDKRFRHGAGAYRSGPPDRPPDATPII